MTTTSFPVAEHYAYPESLIAPLNALIRHFNSFLHLPYTARSIPEVPAESPSSRIVFALRSLVGDLQEQENKQKATRPDDDTELFDDDLLSLHVGFLNRFETVCPNDTLSTLFRFFNHNTESDNYYHMSEDLEIVIGCMEIIAAMS